MTDQPITTAAAQDPAASACDGNRSAPAVLAIPGRIWRRLRRYYRRYFQNRNHVFVHRGPFPPEHRDDCTF